MTKILVSAELHGVGGTETHLLNLCRVLRRSGAQVTLVTRIARAEVPLVQEAAALGIRHVSTPFARHRDLLRASTAWSYATWPLRLERGFDALYSFGVGRFTS